MALLMTLIKDSVSPPTKKVCVDNSSQSASHRKLLPNKNQFLEQTTSNQFAMLSLGDQFSIFQDPTGSLDVRISTSSTGINNTHKAI